MDGEFKNFIKVWTSSTTCLIYCYYISSKLPKGLLRLVSILPIIYLFTTLPFLLTTYNLGTTSAFFLVWLANFKLLLFCFDRGPLSPLPPNILHFIFIASLPVKPKNYNNLKHSENPRQKSRFLALKSTLFVFLIYSYKYKHLMNPYLVLSSYCVNLYIGLEFILAVSATPVRLFFGFEIEPQFNEPYLSTSLQDFWGRRWNLMVTSILRPTIYYPTRSIFTYVIGPTFSFVPAVLACFVLSGLMHEIIFFHATRVSPTWEVTWFFILNGVCVVVEVVVKKVVGDRWRLPPLVSRPLTVAFVAVTGIWLFFPELTRCGIDEKAIGEYYSVVNFVNGIARRFWL